MTHTDLGYRTGVILALHKSRMKGDFVVVCRVTGTEYPPTNIQQTIDSYLKHGEYLAVWFQEVMVPKVPK